MSAKHPKRGRPRLNVDADPTRGVGNSGSGFGRNVLLLRSRDCSVASKRAGLVERIEGDPVGAWVDCALAGSTSQSITAYRNQCGLFLRELAAYGFTPDDPGAADAITNVLHDCVARGNSAASVRRKIEAMGRLWRWLNEVVPGTIPQACFDALRCPRHARERPPIRTLNIEQQAALLAFARGWLSPNWRRGVFLTFVSFGLLMALRPPELLHLDWSELHLSSERPWLALKDLSRRKVKNRFARFGLSLPPGLAGLLAAYFTPAQSGPVFPADDGWSHRPALRAAGKAIGAPWFNLYALRRTCITNWHRQGVELQKLTVLSRHANPVILNQHYLERPAVADIETGLPLEAWDMA